MNPPQTQPVFDISALKNDQNKNDSFSFDRLSVAVLAAAEDVEVLASIFSLWQLEGLIREGRGEFSYIYKFCDVLFQVFYLETQMSNSNKMYLNFLGHVEH